MAAPRGPRKPIPMKIQDPPGRGAVTQGLDELGKRLRKGNPRQPAQPMRRTGAAPAAPAAGRLPTAQELLERTAPRPSTGAMPTAAELLGDWESVTPEGEDDYAIYAPTASSEPARPRTLEMTYSPSRQILRVVYRNGGTYEYYDFPRALWAQVKRVKSPGKFLDRRVLGAYKFTKVSA